MPETKRRVSLDDMLILESKQKVAGDFKKSAISLDSKIREYNPLADTSKDAIELKKALEFCFSFQTAIQKETAYHLERNSTTKAFSTAYSFYVSATESLKYLIGVEELIGKNDKNPELEIINSYFNNVKMDPNEYPSVNYSAIMAAFTDRITDPRIKASGKNLVELGKDYLEAIRKTTLEVIDNPKFAELRSLAETLEVEYKGKIISGIEKIELKKKHFVEQDNIQEVRFDDIGGYQELKEECRDIARIIKNYEWLKKEMKNPIEKGFLFYGPPGTGKTMFANAIAYECGSYFFYVDCTTIANSLVFGASGDLRDIFEESLDVANSGKYPSVVLFFDEIDSIAPIRNENNHEDNKVVGAFLTYMNSRKIETKVPRFHIAATNRKDQIDPALLRPGRFERHIEVAYPTQYEREDIFKTITRLAQDYAVQNNGGFKRLNGVDHKLLAENTDGFTGSHISAFLDKAMRNYLLGHIKDGQCKEHSQIKAVGTDYLIEQLKVFKEKQRL